MKRSFTVIVFFLIALSVYGQSNVSLDEAILNSANQIQDGLNRGSKIVVYQFQSHNKRVSDYVLKEMFNLLVNSKKFTVLDRASQDVIKAERDFQYVQNAGMVSDESLMSLTKIIGAQAIVTGSLEDMVTEYRFYVKVIGTETTEALVSFAGSVSKNDKRINALRPKNAGDKIGTGALNILLGLGSYIEGDVAGGITLTAGYALAAGLFVTEALAVDWDSPMVGVLG
ncbi:MAG: penicillin-binding protein activator LpoB, partial [Treponema sp.]|nr:penicillin-binding protein activator LpoB [Treponema sp.]